MRGVKKSRIKKSRLPLVFIGIILLTGIGLVAYPIVSNIFYEINKSELMAHYDDASDAMPLEEKAEALRKAEEYNASLLTADVVLTDPFDPSVLDRAGEEPYASLLNINGDGIMGYVDIPLIDAYLPIYHGTAAATLEKGIGHLESTSLPVGGTGTHAVLTGHTGLAGEKMFTDLTALEKGDLFYVHVLGNTLAYQVDQIEVTEPEDTSLLLIDREADYITLLTCYPYGINSHRLLVRGTRTDYQEARAREENGSREAESRWDSEYRKALILCVILYIPLTILILFFIRKKKRRSLR